MPPDQYRYNEASGWYERRSVNQHGEVSWFPLDSVEEELNRLYALSIKQEDMPNHSLEKLMDRYAGRT